MGRWLREHAHRTLPPGPVVLPGTRGRANSRQRRCISARRPATPAAGIAKMLRSMQGPGARRFLERACYRAAVGVLNAVSSIWWSWKSVSGRVRLGNQAGTRPETDFHDHQIDEKERLKDANSCPVTCSLQESPRSGALHRAQHLGNTGSRSCGTPGRNAPTLARVCAAARSRQNNRAWWQCAVRVLAQPSSHLRLARPWSAPPLRVFGRRSTRAGASSSSQAVLLCRRWR